MTLQNRFSWTKTQRGSPAARKPQRERAWPDPGPARPADAKAVWLYFNPVIPELRTLPREGEEEEEG